MTRALTRTPGLLRLFVASLVGRLPMGAISLVAILRVEELTGSYAKGGLVAGAAAIAHGVGAPVLGRLADRHGQTALLVRAAIVHACALGAFALLPAGTGFEPALVLMAVAGATQPPLSAAQRAIWSNHLLDADDRHKLYSFEAAIFEMVYICGPLVIVGALGAWSLQGAAAACALFTLGGTIAFAATPLSREWSPDPTRSTHFAGALRGSGVRALTLAFLLIGAAFAAVEIAVAALAASGGSRSAVGVLLTMWGIGSLLGGYYVARRAAPADAPNRFTLLLVALAASTGLLAVAGDDLLLLGALLFVAGVPIAPAFGCAFNLLSDVAPAGTVTEAQTMVSTGIGTGFGLGSAFGGWIVEAVSAAAAFGLAGGALALAAAIIAARRGVLRADVREPRVVTEPLPQPAPLT